MILPEHELTLLTEKEITAFNLPQPCNGNEPQFRPQYHIVGYLTYPIDRSKLLLARIIETNWPFIRSEDTLVGVIKPDGECLLFPNLHAFLDLTFSERYYY